MSGPIYESEISSTIKFEIVKDLSESTVVDVSGTYNFCFAVLNDGRVFGRGSNWNCKLGLPEETKSVSTFTLIESLNKYKIVSVFTGSEYSIFKTTENKMIVCGSNRRGQLFIPLKKFVYPPEEVPKCQGFTFCVTDGDCSSVFFDMEAPHHFSNNKIIEGITTKVKAKNENKEEELRSEIEELKRKLLKKEEEKSELKKIIKNMKEEKSDRELQSLSKNLLPILGSNEMKSYKKSKKIGRGATSEVYEAIQETKLSMKVLDLEMIKI